MEEKPRVLYKYRGLSNMQFTLDILVNQRMFAAEFNKLNDPMEGTYLYEQGTLSRRQIDAIYGMKMAYRLLALSETPTNMLMWSHYAEGHSGMVVGVSVIDPEADIKRVRYVEDLSINMRTHNLAKEILTKKFTMWEYEREHRVFIRNESFVKVRIEELIFGFKANPDRKELLSSIAKKFCPSISVRTIELNELEKGKGNTADA
jgi:hypothetical protein